MTLIELKTIAKTNLSLSKKVNFDKNKKLIIKTLPINLPPKDMVFNVIDETEEITDTVPKISTKTAVIQGTEIRQGMLIQLQGIHFKTNSAEFTDLKGVQQLLTFMKEYSKAKIELSGHTDRNPDKNTPDYESICQQFLELSQKRVDAVANFLIKNGIESERIITKAFGGTKPLVASFSSEKNRRVELRILQIE
jgi:outer membrane protein OmpA-like peptidoglycan-associated protein